MDNRRFLQLASGLSLAVIALVPSTSALSVAPQVAPPGHHRLPTRSHEIVFQTAQTATALNGPGGSVSIRADGTVKITGPDKSDRLVKTRVSHSYLQYLLREFEVAGYFKLPAQISGTGIIADAPQQTLTVNTRHKGYTVTEIATLTPAPQEPVFAFLSLLVGAAAGLHVYPPPPKTPSAASGTSNVVGTYRLHPRPRSRRATTLSQ